MVGCVGLVRHWGDGMNTPTIVSVHLSPNDAKTVVGALDEVSRYVGEIDTHHPTADEREQYDALVRLRAAIVRGINR